MATFVANTPETPLSGRGVLSADTGPLALPYALAELADNHHLSLVEPVLYFPTRAQARAAGEALGHTRWIVANVTVKVPKPRGVYEYADPKIALMKSLT